MKNINLIKSRYEELNNKLSSSSLTPGNNEYIDLTRELSSLGEIISLTDQIDALNHQLTSAKELMDMPEYKELAITEVDNLSEKVRQLQELLEAKLRTPLPEDDKKAIFEIRPGVGGAEASLFAEDLFRMYSRYCNNKNYKSSLYYISYENDGGIKEVVFLVDKKGSFGEFRFEAGVHRVQRVPATEAAGRIHTSTASIVILPESPDVSIEIKPDDLRIDVYRASGPGGQSVNTTDSAVRITHLPTNIVVTCQEGKSQHKNKEIALSILKSKLYALEQRKKEQELESLRHAAMQGGERSAKIRTYNFPQGRITDHRIGKSWFNISEVMNGYLDEIVDEVSSQIRQNIENGTPSITIAEQEE